MKTLLFILLASVACKGQQPTLDAGYFTNVNIDVVRSLTSDEEKLIAMEMLLNYSIECYNDSILNKVRYEAPVISITGENLGVGSEKAYYYKEVWIHRKPTFEGFIEWLRKRQ